MMDNQRSAKPVVMLSLSKHLAVPGRDRCRTRQRRLVELGSTALRVTCFLVAIFIGVSTITFADNVTSTIDGGGQRTSSASYINDGSICGIAGIVTDGTDTAKQGYIGQLTEVSRVAVTGTPAQVSECATTQLSGTATLDDDSVTALAGNEIAWAVPSWPIQNINAAGLATTAAVYANTPGTVYGWYLGVLGSGTLLVLDTIPDNYGTYANDGIPDNWQVQYFGVGNPNAAPGIDADGTGQNNLFKYIAGLDPTNPASIFTLRIQNVVGQPGQKNLVFNPRWNDRTYTPLYRTNLVATASWTNLTAITTSDNSTTRTVTDLTATNAAKFYRINISYP